MSKKRWLAPWKDSSVKPAIYHIVSRIVDRRFIFEDAQKAHFRMLMRMLEVFSGCHVLAYCIMSNHYHILLEVPPMPAEGLSDAEFERRLLALYSDGVVADIMKRMQSARAEGRDAEAKKIYDKYAVRMHSLSHYMQNLLQRFSRWFNKKNDRDGVLWEERFTSVLVEDGTAAKAMTAYIDLNPVRAGIVTDPALYPWSSYGEAIGGSSKDRRKKARAGLIRVMRGPQEAEAGNASATNEPDDTLWNQGVSASYRKMLMRGAGEKTEEIINADGQTEIKVHRKGMTPEEIKAAGGETGAGNEGGSGEIPWSVIFLSRLRYFTAGVVIGSKEFVDEFFEAYRDEFGPKRKSGARKLQGIAAAANGELASLRDLQKDVARAADSPK